MAAKLLHSLTDENPDLQKQIGCMTGIFQLFDRQQIITGRRIGGHSPKRFPSGNSHVYGGAFEAESDNIYHRPTAKERISTKNVFEKQRVSIESSRPSFSSSSHSSSFSSLDCNIRTNQPEPSSFDRVIFPEPTSRDHTMSQSSASPQHGRSSLDLRDVVKDSIYRDAWGLSIKTTSQDELSDRVMKLKDSPRQTLPMELKESIRVLAKLREAPWYHDESPERLRSSFESKNGSTLSVSKDAPRFSYDGRETTRSTPKQKELPRLSLDSREGSMRSFNSDSKSHFLFRNSYRESGNSDNKVQGPSVVAKLMGLETLPDADAVTNNPIRLIKTSSDGDSDPFSRSSKPIVGPISSSSRNLWKEPASPRRKNGDLLMKPVPNSRFPIEPAPWKQLHGTRGSQKPVLRHVKTPAKPINSFPSVYSEIEKRLKDLEFTESGKDLRALKQILEAMQLKGLLDNTRKEGPDCDFATQRDQMPTHIQSQMSAILVNKQHTHSERAQSSRIFESPIVIMKPAKLVEKAGIPASSVIPTDRLSGSDKLRGGEYLNNRKILANNRTSKEHVLKTSVRDTCSADNKRTNHRTSKSAQSSICSQNLPKENITSSLKNSSSVSPRLQQKKLELEKRSRPPISPESNKTRRQPIKHQTESSSPGGKRRPKSVRLQQNDDQYSEVSSETKNLSCQEDYTEVTSSELFDALNGNQSPSLKAAKYTVSSLVQQRFAPKLSEDGELAEFSSVAPEYPSPVSVLDDTMYTDDALSPVKRMSDVLKDEATVNNNPDREQQNIAGDLVSNTAINRKKLKNIENLVQKLRRVNSSHDEAHTDYIASLCENTNPDHRYISEILLASGLLLRDLNSSLSTFQLHPSGFPINPELFLVLEQTKASTLEKERFDFEKVVRMKSDKEKFHRKLIFDAVNEILVKKLTLMGANKLARRSLNAQQLLRDLCSEIENLQASKSNCVLEDEDDSLKRLLWEYVINSSESWTDFDSEISWLVLDVERMIFKDLVSEIVHGGAVRIKAGRRCRQLFS